MRVLALGVLVSLVGVLSVMASAVDALALLAAPTRSAERAWVCASEAQPFGSVEPRPGLVATLELHRTQECGCLECESIDPVWNVWRATMTVVRAGRELCSVNAPLERRAGLLCAPFDITAHDGSATEIRIDLRRCGNFEP